jgi:hypothetical protein
MGRVWKRPALVLSGLLLTAVCALPDAYTISAKPGAVNYIEGKAFLNDKPLSDKGLKSVFLDKNDVLSTDGGKTEVLLTPGAFLRMGDDSQIRMISPSLTDIQVEVSRGEVMLEVSGLVKGTKIQIINHGSSTTIEKNGLYRFTADIPPVAAVLDGKAEVALGDRTIHLKKGKQTVLTADLRPEKFDTKKADDLYAWSNVRSEYEAAASFRVAQSAYTSGIGRSRGYGVNGFYSPGWWWDSTFDCWAWLPGSGAFYSPFGYGFYSPALVAYAPVVLAPVYRGGVIYGPGHFRRAPGNGIRANVPLDPRNPAAVGTVTASPWANREARMAAARSMMQSGLRTASGAPAPSFGPSLPSADQGLYGPAMPGARYGGPFGMPGPNPTAPATIPSGNPGAMPTNSGNPGGMPGGQSAGPPPSMPSGGNPGGMPGGHPNGPSH